MSVGLFTLLKGSVVHMDVMSLKLFVEVICDLCHCRPISFVRRHIYSLTKIAKLGTDIVRHDTLPTMNIRSTKVKVGVMRSSGQHLSIECFSS